MVDSASKLVLGHGARLRRISWRITKTAGAQETSGHQQQSVTGRGVWKKKSRKPGMNERMTTPMTNGSAPRIIADMRASAASALPRLESATRLRTMSCRFCRVSTRLPPVCA